MQCPATDCRLRALVIFLGPEQRTEPAMQRNTDDILRTLEQAKRRSAGGWIVGILIFAAVLGGGFWYVTLKKSTRNHLCD